MRPDKDEYWMNIAKTVATRATCIRRSVGCVIVSSKNFLLATGYNGPPSGIQHCIDVPCNGSLDEQGDTRRCEAVHAEQNALLQLGAGYLNAETLYTTTFPCFVCAKLICQTTISRIVYLDPYFDLDAERILDKKGVTYELYYKF